jgi:hypothetical protein
LNSRFELGTPLPSEQGTFGIGILLQRLSNTEEQEENRQRELHFDYLLT